VNAPCAPSAGITTSTALRSSPTTSPATISCSHSISGYYVILWYQKPIGGSALKLIGYIANTSPTLEKEFEDRFTISGDGSKESELEVQELQPEDSSMYYCAAISQHSDENKRCELKPTGCRLTSPTEPVKESHEY
uniref:Ig-like domain-containing protein n=1 Tax=Xiphophorus couchianus TaxID=32473 RepID=A0A3B5LC14_9TELE